jgi:hypothetical protein
MRKLPPLGALRAFPQQSSIEAFSAWMRSVA